VLLHTGGLVKLSVREEKGRREGRWRKRRRWTWWMCSILYLSFYVLTSLCLFPADFGEMNQLEGVGRRSVGPLVGQLPCYAPELLRSGCATLDVADPDTADTADAAKRYEWCGGDGGDDDIIINVESFFFLYFISFSEQFHYRFGHVVRGSHPLRADETRAPVL
jgi:hypothetical protein